MVRPKRYSPEEAARILTRLRDVAEDSSDVDNLDSPEDSDDDLSTSPIQMLRKTRELKNRVSLLNILYCKIMMVIHW